MTASKGWIIDRAQWNTLKELLQDRKWGRKKLEQIESHHIPECPGIYLICSLCPDVFTHPHRKKFYNVIYVGKANRRGLRARFLDHCRNPQELIRNAKMCFGDPLDYWYLKLEVHQTANYETAVYDCFGPAANEIRPKSLSGKIRTPVPAGRKRKE